jgi:predicted Co/Zn/Cd cation transporter (cation efflux family)
MVVEPEVILILISLAAVGAIFFAAWRRSSAAHLQTSDVTAWLLEQMVVLAVLIVFVTIAFLLFTIRPIS